MIEEIEGTVPDTLRLLATHTLDPQDETLFIQRRWTDAGTVWELQGQFLDSDARFHLRYAGDLAGVEELREAIGANLRSAEYQAAWRALVPHLERWLAIGGRNPWIREADDPPFTQRSFTLCRTAAQVANMVDRNNWTVGQAFVLVGANICMIQQNDGPGEFLMIREGLKFDSWTTGRPHIHGPMLVAYLNAVANAQINEHGEPEWYDLVRTWDEGESSGGVLVADTAADILRFIA
jgi:hypothetical protein